MKDTTGIFFRENTIDKSQRIIGEQRIFATFAIIVFMYLHKIGTMLMYPHSNGRCSIFRQYCKMGSDYLGTENKSDFERLRYIDVLKMIGYYLKQHGTWGRYSTQFARCPSYMRNREMMEIPLEYSRSEFNRTYQKKAKQQES